MSALPPTGATGLHAAALPSQPLARRVLHHVAGGLALCTAVAAFITVMFNEAFWPNWVLSVCIGGCIQAQIEAARYGISAWMLRRGHRSARLDKHWPGWTVMAPVVLVASLLGYWAGLHLGSALLGLPVQFQGRHRALVLVLTVTVVVSAVATYSFYMRSQLATIAAQAEAARRLAGEHQLRLLQSQLEPHMLFNTLANLRALVTLDPPRAQAMLDHLVRYLRATLGASHTTLHPLAVEFDRLADYLALMALRMGPRLQVQLQLPEALRQLPVPTLLLQPLVENSIRHGLEPQVAGGRIEVRAQRQGDVLLLTVRDTGIGLDDAAGTPAVPGNCGPSGDASPRHFGTRHVAERLATLYGSRASFSLRSAGDAAGGTLAELRLPLPPALPG